MHCGKNTSAIERTPIYADPPKTMQGQAGLVAPLRSTKTRLTVADLRAGQFLTFLLAEGIVQRYQRQEILRADLADEIVGHLVDHIADRYEANQPHSPDVPPTG